MGSSQGRREAASYLVVAAIQLAVIWPLAMKRALDEDEGFYAMAAKLVARGKEPYFDFWFQHTPGLPFVYGTWTRLTGDSFEALRALSAILTVVLGVLLYAHVAHRFSRRSGLVAVLLYITSGLVFAWYSTYKHYALSVLLLFVAYVLVAAADRGNRPSAARWLAAGVFLGLSIDVRLLFVMVIPVFVYYAVDRGASRPKRFANIVPLLGGFVIGLLPFLVLVARDPRPFIDDVVLSQANRTDLSLLDSIVQRLRVTAQLGADAQFVMFVAAAVALIFLLYANHRRPPLALALAIALALASLTPAPTYDQYFSTAIPFLVICVVELWHMMRTAVPRPSEPRVARALRPVVVAGLLLYVAAGAQSFDSMMNTGDLLIDARKARSISEEIDARTGPGEVVLAFAPVDLYESHATPLPGLESNFGTFDASNQSLSDAEASRRKLITLDRLEQVIRSGEIRTVVLRRDFGFVHFPRPWAQILTDSGYSPVATIHNRTIYQLPPDAVNDAAAP